MGKELLIETIPVAFTILEDGTSKNGGRMKIRGVFTVADEINGNGRVYSEALLDREIGKLKELMAENRVFGEADHPEDGKSRIANAATLMTDITKTDKDGRKLYVGEAIVLNTTKGKDLQEIIRAGGRPGVSSRGFGSLLRGNWQGKQADIVQEDFSLKTFDFVIGQSTKGAEVTQFVEQMDVVNIINADDASDQNRKGGGRVMEIKTIDDLKKAYPELCESLVKDALAAKEKELKETLEKDFGARVDAGVAAMKETIKEEVVQQLKESEEFQGMVGTLVEIGKLVQPYMEGADLDDDDDELEDRVAKLETELETEKAEKAALKEQIESEKKGAENKAAVTKKIEELCAGKEHEKLLVERLSNCVTADEVVKRFAEEEAFIKKIAGGKEDPSKGKGKVLNEDKKDEQLDIDDVQKRQRALAGLA